MRREWVETNHSFKFVHLIILLLLRIRSTLPIFVQQHTSSLPQILRRSFLGNEVSELGVDGVKAEDGIFGRTSAGESLLPFDLLNTTTPAVPATPLATKYSWGSSIHSGPIDIPFGRSIPWQQWVG